MQKSKPRLAFFASGRGSNVQALLDACQSGQLDATPVLVISNNTTAPVLDMGKAQNLTVKCFNQSMYANAAALDDAIHDCLQDLSIDWILLAGYMKKIGPVVLQTYVGRIINIHPSLLPKFGGEGMYGMHVHRAVLAAGEKETGVTIHHVTEEYDQGDIIMQKSLAIEENASAESLAANVLKLEHQLYPVAVQQLITK